MAGSSSRGSTSDIGLLEGKAELTKLTKLRSNWVKQGELSEVKQDARECNKKLDFYCVQKIHVSYTMFVYEFLMPNLLKVQIEHP